VQVKVDKVSVRHAGNLPRDAKAAQGRDIHTCESIQLSPVTVS
jgi:hypothetical protein